jgi:hypothetical protein
VVGADGARAPLLAAGNGRDGDVGARCGRGDEYVVECGREDELSCPSATDPISPQRRAVAGIRSRVLARFGLDDTVPPVWRCGRLASHGRRVTAQAFRTSRMTFAATAPSPFAPRALVPGHRSHDLACHVGITVLVRPAVRTRRAPLATSKDRSRARVRGRGRPERGVFGPAQVPDAVPVTSAVADSS